MSNTLDPCVYGLYVITRQEDGLSVEQEMLQMGRLLSLDAVEGNYLNLDIITFKACGEDDALQGAQGILGRRAVLGEKEILYSQLEVIG